MAELTHVIISINMTTVSNHTTDNTPYDEDGSFYHYLLVVTVPILFALIILIGTIGNLLVVIVILTNKKMKNLTNILLFNLAIADLTFLLTCVPFQAYKFASFTFAFGDVVCKLVQYSLFVTGYVTVYTLVAISVLRYMTVVQTHATLRYRTKRNVIIACVVIWITMLVLNIPTLFSHQLHVISNGVVYISFCGVVQKATKPLVITFFLAGYLIPLIAVTFLYLLIIIHLQQHQVPQNQSARSQQRTSHAFRVIIVVVVVFGISWLPFHVHTLVSVYGSLPKENFYEVLRILWYCMAYGNSLVNPFIYTFISSDFRDSFKNILMSNCCKEVNGKCSSGETIATDVHNIINDKEHEGEEMRPLNHDTLGKHQVSMQTNAGCCV